jgi:hypothetical protein
MREELDVARTALVQAMHLPLLAVALEPWRLADVHFLFQITIQKG